VICFFNKLSYFQPVASTINTLAGALYKVFSASPDQARNEMRQACFDYLSLGGVFSNGPIALLSGLNPRPLSLVAHFFAVAIYGVGRLMLPLPSPKRMWIGARLISVSPLNHLLLSLHSLLCHSDNLWKTTCFDILFGQNNLKLSSCEILCNWSVFCRLFRII
jgi:hypothetical protein